MPIHSNSNDTLKAQSVRKFIDKGLVTGVILLGVVAVFFLTEILFFSYKGDDAIEVLGLIVILVAIFVIVRSIKNQARIRQGMEELASRLKAIDKQKSEFISMAAHELRAPMSAIKGYVSMVMEGDAGEISEKARRFLVDANDINDRLIRLVNNMLNVSRIEEGRMVFQMEEDNLAHSVRSVFAQFTPEAERKGLKYTLKIPGKIRDKVLVDADRIQEVISNLLSNAVKYTQEGSVKVRLTQPNKNTVRFEVIDTGPGISQEERQKLFQKFQRVETNVGKTTGTGLGLYISKLLIEKFKGRIGLDSKLGKGSTFWFELPLVGSS